MRAVLGLAALLLLVVVPPQARAATDLRDAELLIPEITLSGNKLRLSTADPQVPLDGAFSYVVEVTPGSKLQSVALKFQVLRENGQLIFERNRSVTVQRKDSKQKAASAGSARTAKTANADKKTTTSPSPAKATPIREVFQRDEPNLNGLGMLEGIYRVECTVSLSMSGGDQQAVVLKDLMVVYDQTHDPQKLLPVVRMTAHPGRNADGVFTTDPTTGSDPARRSQLDALCAWITDNDATHLTLALSPLLLEEWADLADGYRHLNAVGDAVEVAADAGAAPAARRTLTALKAACATGRLRLTTQGYADPDLFNLRAAGLSADVTEQYRQGLSVLRELTGSEPATLTAPAAGLIAVDDLPAIAAATVDVAATETTAVADGGSTGSNDSTAVDIEATADPENLPTAEPELPTVVVSAAALKSGKAPAATLAVSGSDTGARILIPDGALTGTFAQTEQAAYLKELLSRRDATDTVVLLTEYPDDPAAMQTLTRNLTATAAYPWLETIAADDPALDPGKRSAKLAVTNGASLGDALRPGAGWDRIIRARRAAAGLTAALPPDNEQATTDIAFAHIRSLIAEAGTDNPDARIDAKLSRPSAAATETLALAQAVIDRADGWFSPVDLQLSAVTLSGSSGKLPITIVNGGDTQLQLQLTLDGGESLQCDPEYADLAIPPRETFIEPTIELANIVSGSVTARLHAGSYVLSEKTVRVSAAYTDKIGIIAVIALAGAVLVIWIWRKTSRLPEAYEAGESDVAGTVDIPDIPVLQNGGGNREGAGRTPPNGPNGPDGPDGEGVGAHSADRDLDRALEELYARAYDEAYEETGND
ncbi:MAG: hypothetical protein LBS17_00410 [Actinomycetes bacterium]|jgi:hypothetical protein|nr:hypothetical protein [Actinomycetes bacterium]